MLMRPEQLAAALGLPLAEINDAQTRRGKIDSARFIASYVAQRQAMVREGQGLATAATRNLHALTRLRGLKIQEMEERLIPTGEVAAYLRDANTAIRQRFAAVESQVRDLSDEQRQQLRAAIADSVADLRGDDTEDWKRNNADDTDDGNELEFG